VIIHVELGFHGIIKEVIWNRSVSDFPKIVKYDEKNWEWVILKDGEYPIDFVFTFSELPKYDPNYGVYAVSLKDLCGEYDYGCQCGARFTSFPSVHMFYCPKWRPW